MSMFPPVDSYNEHTRKRVFDAGIQEKFDEYVMYATKALLNSKGISTERDTPEACFVLNDVKIVLEAHANQLREELLKLLDDQIVFVAENAESLKKYNFPDIIDEARTRQHAAGYLSETRSLLANWPYEMPSSNYVEQQTAKILELENDVTHLVLINHTNEDKIEELQGRISALENELYDSQCREMGENL